jgi:hypothetical protein
MADEVPGLLSPSAIGRVGHDLPRREPPPSRHRQPPPRRPPAGDPEPDSNPDTGEPCLVGSRLNVRV